MAKETFGLTSTWLLTGTYDPETQDLTVATASGRDYTHPGVPPDIVEGLKQAKSAGSYYNANIKGVYG